MRCGLNGGPGVRMVVAVVTNRVRVPVMVVMVPAARVRVRVMVLVVIYRDRPVRHRDEASREIGYRSERHPPRYSMNSSANRLQH